MRFSSSFALSVLCHAALLAAILFWPASLMPRADIHLDTDQPVIVGWLTLENPGGRTGSKPGTVPPGLGNNKPGGGVMTKPAAPQAPEAAPAIPQIPEAAPVAPPPAPEPPAPPAPEPPAVPAAPEPPAPAPQEAAPKAAEPAPAPAEAPAPAVPADTTPISAHKEADAPAPAKSDKKDVPEKAASPAKDGAAKKGETASGKKGSAKTGQDALKDALADARRNVTRRDNARSRGAVSDALKSMRTDAVVMDALRDIGGEEGYGGGEGRGAGGGTGDGVGVQVSYQTMVSTIIRNYWTYPNQGDRSVPVAVAYVRLSGAGEVIDYRIEKTSGRKDFDASVLAAIRRANHHPLPAPPSGREEEFTIRFYNAERR